MYTKTHTPFRTQTLMLLLINQYVMFASDIYFAFQTLQPETFEMRESAISVITNKIRLHKTT